MLFDRQKRLLALVDALGGRVGSLDFQKILFLYCQEAEEKPTYELTSSARPAYIFFLGTTQEFHFRAPNQWVIVGVFPIPHERQIDLL